MKTYKSLLVLILVITISCKEKLPEIKAQLVTEKTPHDTDDPAIWINKDNIDNSIVFGTDKDDFKGGIYAFDLKGKIIEDKTIKNVSYPNNVDVEYNFALTDSTSTDIIVFSQREKSNIRLFSVPDMKPLDNGGFKVFEDENDIERKKPMGVSLYKNPINGKTYAIVSRKVGPQQNYLYQYELISSTDGVKANLVRKFGTFSGQKEIEAIAVDDSNGFVYYSDEGVGIRKYYANPEKGNEELAFFGGEYFEDDIEGIAIAKYEDKGFLIVSNQQAHTFNIFDLKTNKFIKEINLGTIETDGCDVVTIPLGKEFPNGLFVSMSDEKNFYFHDLKTLELDNKSE